MIHTLPTDLLGHLLTFFPIRSVEGSIKLISKRFLQVVDNPQVCNMRTTLDLSDDNEYWYNRLVISLFDKYRRFHTISFKDCVWLDDIVITLVVERYPGLHSLDISGIYPSTNKRYGSDLSPDSLIHMVSRRCTDLRRLVISPEMLFSKSYDRRVEGTVYDALAKGCPLLETDEFPEYGEDLEWRSGIIYAYRRPTCNDDSSIGCSRFMSTTWTNRVTDAYFLCLDDTVGQAVWRKI